MATKNNLAGALSVALILIGPALLADGLSVDQLTAEGTRLHDEGDYKGAIGVYEEALAIDPGNPIVLYELANTYGVSGNYSRCVALAQEAMKEGAPVELIAPAYVVLGSCFSAWGKPKKALRSFNAGLEKAPGDVGLNFNIAVTLAVAGRDQEAMGHLESALRIRPTYSSPYYLLAELHRRGGRRIPALLLFSRFVALESNSSRSETASTAIFELLARGIEVQPDSTISVSLELRGDDDPYGPLELGLSMAAALMNTDEEKAKGESERHAAALVSFWNMVAEMGPPAGHEDSIVWTWNEGSLMKAGAEAELETFAYLVVLRAQIPGAADWLEGHRDRVRRLEKILSSEGGS